MNERVDWLGSLREMLDRQKATAGSHEQIALAAHELLASVPDYEVCEALKYASGAADVSLTAVLRAECEGRNLDFE